MKASESKDADVFVEICRKRSTHSEEKIKSLAYEYICSQRYLTTIIRCDANANIAEHIEEITISNVSAFPMDFDKIKFFVYILSESIAEIEVLENESGDCDEVPASHHWILPNRDFQNQWEYLIYEKGLKENILQFAKTVMTFAQKKIDTNVISCNKLVLLHGPPGTGKTSLCKALTQKLSIHMHNKFPYTHLFEINSHSLFSKWFSESGKLVLKLFTNIKQVAEHPQSLVVILIDEVESLVFARDAVSSSEPSDSLRVVNAVLTQLDQLRKYSNVLVLTTSNLTSTIDLAFVDRADLKQFIGQPNIEAVYEILRSAIDELSKVDIISTTQRLCAYSDVFKNDDHDLSIFSLPSSAHLLQISEECIGLSGRTLRKLPLLAHAWFIRTDRVTMEEYLKALQKAVAKHWSDAANIQNK